MARALCLSVCVVLFAAVAARTLQNEYKSEVWSKERELKEGVVHNDYRLPLPKTYIKAEDVPGILRI